MGLEKKARPESLDFFLAAIAPVFIIGMIGSLVYFVITVCYQGSHTERLMWILGLYTVAAVLIARIAIEQSRQLAFAYMFALAAATLIVTPQFFVVSGAMAIFSFPILVFLLVMVAVLADRITFDCTSMNEHLQSTGVGLLQSLGLVKTERQRSEPKANWARDAEEPPSITKKKRSSSQRKHNPGVWVLYFALFALPLFGLGQLVIQSPADRRSAFTYLFFYLLSSLFLLVLISLLSLRKYLRERGVPMETAFVVRWLAIGMTSIFLVVFVLSLLPIPGHSLLSIELPFRIASRDDLKASKWGWGREGVDGDGPQKGEGEAQDKPGGTKDGKGPDEGGAQAGNKQKEGEEKQSQAGNEKQPTGQTKDIKPGDQNKIERGDPQPPDNAKKEIKDQKEIKDRRADVKQPPQENKREGQQPQPQPTPPSLSIQWNLSAALQWLLMIAMAIAAVVYSIVYRRELFVAFKSFQDWLSSLFGASRKQKESNSQSMEEATLLEDLYPPFHTFANPFVSGNGWTREQVVRHMYRAILSWGYEQRIVRREDETPEEFMRRLFRRFPEQQESFSALGMLYNRIAYARGKVSTAELKPMTELWQWLVAKTV